MSDFSSVISLVALEGGAGWVGGPWWLLFPLFWIAVFGTIIWLVSRRKWRDDGRQVRPAADILAARYARGEIETAEYRERLDEINGLS